MTMPDMYKRCWDSVKVADPEILKEIDLFPEDASVTQMGTYAICMLAQNHDDEKHELWIDGGTAIEWRDRDTGYEIVHGENCAVRGSTGFDCIRLANHADTGHVFMCS
jgi:hypothetical protein